MRRAANANLLPRRAAPSPHPRSLWACIPSLFPGMALPHSSVPASGLPLGRMSNCTLRSRVGSVQQTVSVVDTPAVVDTSTLQTQGLVDERQVKELPLNGRSFDQLIQLNPASVSYTTQRSGGVGTSNSSVGNMYSVSGRRPQDNLFLLNGIEYTGASLINVTPGRHQRAVAGSGRSSRIQRGQRYLWRELWQAHRRADIDHYRVRRKQAPRLGV